MNHVVAERTSYFVCRVMVVAYFHLIRMTDAILPRSPPWGNIKGRANHLLPSPQPYFEQDGSLLALPPSSRTKPANMTEHILLSSPSSSRTKPANMTEHILLSSPSSSRTSQFTWQSIHSLCSLPSNRKNQPTWETTLTFLLWLFFTDSLSHISSSPLSTMRRPHPIYGPLVFGKSFFHHSSFLLNQRILGETNWIFSTPVLT